MLDPVVNRVLAVGLKDIVSIVHDVSFRVLSFVLFGFVFFLGTGELQNLNHAAAGELG